MAISPFWWIKTVMSSTDPAELAVCWDYALENNLAELCTNSNHFYCKSNWVYVPDLKECQGQPGVVCISTNVVYSFADPDKLYDKSRMISTSCKK